MGSSSEVDGTTQKNKNVRITDAGRGYSCPVFVFLFVLENSLFHLWKIKKVGNRHVQPYRKAVQSSEGNILCLSRHDVLYGRMAYAG